MYVEDFDDLYHLVVRMSGKYDTYALYIESTLALSIGVATVANKKALFVRLVDRVPQFEAY